MGHAARRAIASPDATNRLLPQRRVLALSLPSALLMLLLGAATARAEECSTAICSGNPCTITGTHLLSDQCELDFGNATVILTGILSSAVDDGSFTIRADTLEVRGKLEALGDGEIDIDVANDFKIVVVSGSQARINVNGGGTVTIDAGDDVAIDTGSNITALGKDHLVGGEVRITARDDITMANNATITVDGGATGSGGTVELIADGDLVVDGTITANGTGFEGSAGYIHLRAGPSGNITVSHTLEAVTGSQGLYDGDIKLGPACDIVVTGNVKTRNPDLDDGEGINSLVYSRNADVGDGTLSSDGNGNEVHCRCTDSNHDRVCDGGCVNGPDLSGDVDPSAVLIPTAMPPCGCGNGTVESSLGETCDDGNSDNMDGCRYDCRLPTCGDGIRDANEQCDHGSLNGNPNDCCASTCQLRQSGSTCSDGNVCTQTDQCDGNGTCVGSNPVTCTALDQCHQAGTCNPVSGCSNPNKPNGTTCNDGNACTTSDVCTNGVCGGACNTGAVCGSSCGGSLHCASTQSGCVCQ